MIHSCLILITCSTFFIQKYAPWRKDFDYAIMLMAQSGLLEKYNKIATYPLQEEGNHFQGQMMKEMMEDGASVVYAVNLNYYHN